MLLEEISQKENRNGNVASSQNISSKQLHKLATQLSMKNFPKDGVRNQRQF